MKSLTPKGRGALKHNHFLPLPLALALSFARHIGYELGETTVDLHSVEFA